jgi:hypothetical protein
MERMKHDLTTLAIVKGINEKFEKGTPLEDWELRLLAGHYESLKSAWFLGEKFSLFYREIATTSEALQRYLENRNLE